MPTPSSVNVIGVPFSIWQIPKSIILIDRLSLNNDEFDEFDYINFSLYRIDVITNNTDIQKFVKPKFYFSTISK